MSEQRQQLSKGAIEGSVLMYREAVIEAARLLTLDRAEDSTLSGVLTGLGTLRRALDEYNAVKSRTSEDPDYVFGLNQLASRIAFTNREKGFSDPSLENIDRKLLLAVSEICEAQDVLRDGHQPDQVFWRRSSDGPTSSAGSLENGDKPDGFPIELADAIIRLLHICSALNIDIAAAVALKVKYNRTRPEKHGRIF